MAKLNELIPEETYQQLINNITAPYTNTNPEYYYPSNYNRTMLMNKRLNLKSSDLTKLKKSLFSDNNTPWNIGVNLPTVSKREFKTNFAVKQPLANITTQQQSNVLHTAPAEDYSKNVPMYQQFINEAEGNRSREILFGVLGYGMQGVNAIGDLINNEQQSLSQSPQHLIPSHIGYRPINEEPFTTQLNQSRNAYLKYLTETGNAQMIPSLYGLEDKANQVKMQIANENNKSAMGVDQFNAQVDNTTNATNAQMDENYTKLLLTEKQMKDAAINSNKETMFGAAAGIGKTFAGNNGLKLKLGVMQQLLSGGNYQAADAMMKSMIGLGENSKQDYSDYEQAVIDALRKNKK